MIKQLNVFIDPFLSRKWKCVPSVGLPVRHVLIMAFWSIRSDLCHVRDFALFGFLFIATTGKYVLPKPILFGDWCRRGGRRDCFGRNERGFDSSRRAKGEREVEIADRPGFRESTEPNNDKWQWQMSNNNNPRGFCKLTKPNELWQMAMTNVE